ncbi:MAG: hypothetical protein ABIS14_12770 [Sphingomonas sp.]
MIKRYRFYRQYHGRLISLGLAPDSAIFWGVISGALLGLLVLQLWPVN